MSLEPARGDVLYRLPEPGQIRTRLANVLREAEVLRRLLRLSEFAESHQPIVSQAPKSEEASR